MNDIVYKKNLIFSVLLILALTELATFFLLLYLDIFKVGNYHQQNAFGGSIVFLFFSLVTFLYLNMINFTFRLTSDKIIILRKSLLNSKTVEEIPYVKITDVEVNALSKTVVLKLENNADLILRFMHYRYSGELPDKSHIGNINGALREINNLQQELIRRINFNCEKKSDDSV